jgi:hypothetical protein
MDIRIYFQKVAAVESNIIGPHAVIVSLETPEGGKAGMLTEVDRNVAARSVVDGRARLATDDESAQFRQDAVASKKAFEDSLAANRVQVTVISEADLRKAQRTV